MSADPTRLKLRYYGDPVLRRRSEAVASVGEWERSIFEQMTEVMRICGGIGLAAPQVGISRQMLLVDIGEGLVKLINPRIVKKSGSGVLEEGCLSLPGVYVKVKRAKKVTIRAFNENNEEVSLPVKDLLARALQHEIDHLRGKLIIDYAGLIERFRLRTKLKSLAEECV